MKQSLRFSLAAALMSLAVLIGCTAASATAPPVNAPTESPDTPIVPEAGKTKLNPNSDIQADMVAQITWVAGGGGGGCGTTMEEEGLHVIAFFNLNDRVIPVTDGVWLMFYGTAANRDDVQFTLTQPDGAISDVPAEWISRFIPYCWDVVMKIEPGMQLGQYEITATAGDQQAGFDFEVVLPDAPVIDYYSDTQMWLAGFQPHESIRLMMYHDHDSDLIGDFIGYQDIVADDNGMQLIDVSGLPFGVVVVAEGSISGSTASTINGRIEIVGE